MLLLLFSLPLPLPLFMQDFAASASILTEPLNTITVADQYAVIFTNLLIGNCFYFYSQLTSNSIRTLEQALITIEIA